MPTPLEQLASQAMALSPEDRARLADLLLASLPAEADEPLDAAWDQEIQGRVKAVEPRRTAGLARRLNPLSRSSTPVDKSSTYGRNFNPVFGSIHLCRHATGESIASKGGNFS